LRKDEFDGVNKRGFEVTEGERGQMGVSTNLGTNMNRRKMINSVNMNVMVDVCAKRGNKGNGVGFKVGDMGEKAEEVSLYVLFLWDPMLFSAVVNDRVLVWVMVNGESTGRGIEEMGEEVSYRYLWEW